MTFDVSRLKQDMCVIDPTDSASYANWGRLVKTWVTGVNQFNNGKNYKIPAAKETVSPLGVMTRDQFQGMLTDAQVKMTIPDKVKRFVFVQDDDTTVIVRIPAKKVVENIQGMIEGLAAGGVVAQYPLPKFYTDQWTDPPKNQNSSALLTMHCQRIGEYTINTCG
jgi:hypothetical protein